MSTPLVSVLMPAYRHERHVRAAVESVLAQTHARLELIVIDDCSPDATWEVLRDIHDDRLRLRRHESNQGAHASLNEAMAIAGGDYIAILNSDDVYAANRLERLLATAAASTGPVLVFSDVAFIDETGDPLATHPRAEDYHDLCRRCDSLAPASWFLAGNPAISTSNFFFSRALYREVGDFTALRFTHDWDWALRAARDTPPIWVREPLLGYRVHAANTLAENDVWRHIHENSHIQAKALLATRHGEGDETAADETCRALLGNRSFHPVALVCYLASRLAGLSDGRLEELTRGREGGWWLRELARAASCPEPVFHSAREMIEREAVIHSQAALLEERLRAIEHMSDEIAHRDEAIAGQAALLEERLRAIEHMSDEIAHRDEAIAGQAALLEERLHAIEHMSGEIAHRDEVIDGQATLLEEKSRTIERMGGDIHALRLDLGASRDELAALHADRLVRIALRLRRMFHQ